MKDFLNDFKNIPWALRLWFGIKFVPCLKCQCGAKIVISGICPIAHCASMGLTKGHYFKEVWPCTIEAWHPFAWILWKIFHPLALSQR